MPAAASAAASGSNLPRSLEKAHPRAERSIGKKRKRSQSTERNIIKKVGTGSGPTDLSGVRWGEDEEEPDWGEDEEEIEEKEAEPATQTGVTDHRLGDGRAPTEANWGLEDLPEKVPDSKLAILVKRGHHSKVDKPRLTDTPLEQLVLDWILGIRRKTMARHGRRPVPGLVTLLAPHYRQGMEMLYQDMSKVIRLVQPDMIPANSIGSSAMAQERLTNIHA